MNIDWEIAPFLDLGAVARNLLDVTTMNFVVNPGVGSGRSSARASWAVSTSASATRGPAIFATLGYPFQAC